MVGRGRVVPVREEIRERPIHLAASDQRNSVADAGTAFDVAGRDRLETSGSHTDTAAGGLTVDAELRSNSFAKEISHGILRTR